MASIAVLGAPIGLLSVAVSQLGSVNPDSAAFPQTGVYRPAGWSQPAITSITVPPNAQQKAAAQAVNQTAQPTIYVFDAALRLDHALNSQITEHPVQTQANISDHVFLLPSRITISIGMSDAMDSYTPGQWSGGASKGITAFAFLQSLRLARTFVTLTTRLKKYDNMQIESISAPEDSATLHGLRALVSFREIFQASVTGVSSGLVFGDTGDADSARPQTTDDTPAGTVQATPPTATVTAQHSISGLISGASGSLADSGVPAGFPTVPGAGLWTSNNLSSLNNVLGSF